MLLREWDSLLPHNLKGPLRLQAAQGEAGNLGVTWEILQLAAGRIQIEQASLPISHRDDIRGSLENSGKARSGLIRGNVADRPGHGLCVGHGLIRQGTPFRLWTKPDECHSQKVNQGNRRASLWMAAAEK